jgi:nucleotide-binding universal stress UspA family protein
MARTALSARNPVQQYQDQLLATALTHARASGLQQVVTLGVEGLPATEIVRVAGDRAVDQIVMGTHGRNALGGLLLGSVAQRVVHLAKVPVLLVK